MPNQADMNSSQEVTTQKLVSDIKVLMADSRELLNASIGLTDERIARLRPKIEGSMRQLGARLAEYQIVQRARESALTADEYVRASPWKAVGIAVAAGAVLGMLLNQRSGPPE